MVKEIISRTFVMDNKEVIERTGLPNGHIVNVELLGEGSISFVVVGEK